MEADGNLEFRYRLEHESRRLTPKQLEEAKNGLAVHYRKTPELVQFSTNTTELVSAGKIEEALKLTRERVEQRTESAAPRIRLSRLLLAAGLGGPAVSEAKRATEIESRSAAAWHSLGFALEHDLFGRRFRAEWRRNEAVAALRRAVDLEPANVEYAAELAILLEHSPSGSRYTRGAQLEEAIRIYQSILKEAKQPYPGVRINLAVALIHSRQLAAAAEAIKEIPAASASTLHPILTALQRGGSQAAVEIQSNNPDPATRINTVVSAGLTLMQMREYGLATELFRAGARLTGDASLGNRADLVARIKRTEDILLPDNDPRSVVQRLISWMVGGETETKPLRSLFTSREKWEDEGQAMAALLEARQNMLESAIAQGVTADNLLDITQSMSVLEQKGDEQAGYVVSTSSAVRAPLPEFFVVKEGGQYRLIGSSHDAEHIGEAVLELLANGEFSAAVRMLDLVVESLDPDRGEASLPAARWIWTGRTDKSAAPADAIRTTAASLLGKYSGSATAVGILESARKKASSNVERDQIDVALCETHTKGERWGELTKVAQRLAASKTFSSDGYRYLFKGLAQEQKWEGLEAVAQTRLQVAKDDLQATRAVLLAKAKNGDKAGVKEWRDRLFDSQLGIADNLAFSIWTTLLVGSEDSAFAEKVTASLKPADMGGRTMAGSQIDVHLALAVLHAKLGQVDKSLASLRQRWLRMDSPRRMHETGWRSV